MVSQYLMSDYNSSTTADNGILKLPTRTSVTAKLDNKILEALCSSFLCFTAMIISAFKRTASGEIIDATAAKTQGEVVSCKSQTKCGSCGQ